jgi:putative nucleotide binding protein
MSDRRNYDRDFKRSGQGYDRNRYQRRGTNQGYRKDRYQRKRSGPKEFYLPQGTIIYVLDILEHGHVSGYRGGGPIIQAIETPNFNLFEMYYEKGVEIKIQEKIVITNKETSKVGKVKKRLKYHGLTVTSKELLQNTIELHLDDFEQVYVKFLNNAGPITKKRHQLNLLPGVGQKVMWEILNERKNPFENFADFDSRVKSINNIKGLLSKRILNEIIDDEAGRYLFVKRRQPRRDNRGSQGSYRSRSRDQRDRYSRGGNYQRRF